jgi:hypothetical protein
MKSKILPALLMAALLTLNAMGQTVDKTPATSSSDSDVASADSIIAALYDVISGGPGVARDWTRFRNLFHPDARLIPTGKDSQSGTLSARSFTPDEYIKRSEPFMMKNGFFEKEIARRTLVFGGIVHCFSTYEGRNKESDPKPFLRGINSIQLLNDGKRWWVLTVYWQAETPDNQLPSEFLKDG